MMQKLLLKIAILSILSQACVAHNLSYCQCQMSGPKKSKRLVCTCNGEKEGKKLRYIPEFPNDTQEVWFTHNDIKHLSREILMPLSSLTLKTLVLNYNEIHDIQNNTFLDLKYLEWLDISGNINISQADLINSLFSLTRTIKTLGLNKFHWHPRLDMFDGLVGTNINKLELSHNFLTPLNGSWFKHLQHLSELDISWNSIVNNLIDFKGLDNLTRLDMTGNWLTTVPDFCKDGINKLVKLFLGSNKFYNIIHLRNNTRCMTKLSLLNIGAISVRTLHNNLFSELKSLSVLTVSQMSTQLTRIQPYAFNSTSLRSLAFWRADGFRFTTWGIQKEFFNPVTFFHYCPNLKSLDLSHNIIEFSNENIKYMFNPLKKLEKIWLEGIGLTYIPKDLFHHFPDIKHIHLTDNRIPSWTDGSVFAGLNKLSKLHFAKNKINMLVSSSIPHDILNNLNLLDLSDNHFQCSCELLWFKNWMKETKVEIRGKNNYTCEHSNDRVMHYNPSTAECHVLLITMTTGFGMAIILTVVIVVYFCRWRLRFQFYKLRSLRNNYFEIPNGDDFRYTAYVIYCLEDLKWVKNQFISKMENEYGFKLCIPHRDFELGKVFSDNIVEHMDASKVVVPIISNNFTKNEWCLFQLAVARNKISKEGKLSIFSVMLEEVEFRNLNAAVYSLIKLSNYATWEDDNTAVKLFWEMIKDNFQ